jgi:hypothetical protein
MIGRQATPCINLFGMYRWFGVVPQGLVVFLSFFFLVTFGVISWDFCWEVLGAFL